MGSASTIFRDGCSRNRELSDSQTNTCNSSPATTERDANCLKWFNEVCGRLDQEKGKLGTRYKEDLQVKSPSCGLDPETKIVTIDPSRSETLQQGLIKFFGLINGLFSKPSSAAPLNNIQQATFNGYCAASSITRGCVPLIRQLSKAHGNDFLGFVLQSLYLVTTCVNLGLAARSHLNQFENESQRLSFMFNRKEDVGRFINASAEQRINMKKEADWFNQFKEHTEKLLLLKQTAEGLQAVSESATAREGAAMLPGGVLSEVSLCNAFVHTLSELASSALKEISGVFQIIGGVLDLRQATSEIKLTRHQHNELKEKLSRISKLTSRNCMALSKPIFGTIGQRIKQGHKDLRFFDFRMLKGSLTISAGLGAFALAALKLAGVIAGMAIISAAALSLSYILLGVLSGVLLLGFLGIVAYRCYRNWQAEKVAMKQQAEAQERVKKIRKIGETGKIGKTLREVLTENPILENKYVALHLIAMVLLDPNKEGEELSTYDEWLADVKTFLNSAGIASIYLDALLMQCNSLKDVSGQDLEPDARLEWLKKKIAPFLLTVHYDELPELDDLQLFLSGSDIPAEQPNPDAPIPCAS